MPEVLQITLAAARVNAGLTQELAAQKMHVNRNTIINWENGKVKPGFAQLVALAQTYGLSVDNIFLPTKLT